MIQFVGRALWRTHQPTAPDQDLDVAKAAPPENGVVKILRRAIPYIAGADYVIIGILVLSLTLNLYDPTLGATLTASLPWLFHYLPTGGVVITGVIAAGLITSRLASLESDQADIATIADDTAKKERTAFLNAQVKICSDQRKQAIGFIIAYIVLVSIPSVGNFDVKNGYGHFVFLALNVGEILVPLLNMRTFTIVESSLQKIDTIRNVMYQSQVAAMLMLIGIGGRARKDTLSKQDLRALRRGGKGDVNGMLQRRQENNTLLVEGASYASLRGIITGVRDGDPLTELQHARYNKALSIARRIRDGADAAASDAVATGDTAAAAAAADMKKQFTRGNHNQLFVTAEMGGQIATKLTHVRTRQRRAAPTKIDEPPLSLSA